MSQTWLDVHVFLVIVVLVHAHAEAESSKIGNGRNVESLIKILSVRISGSISVHI